MTARDVFRVMLAAALFAWGTPPALAAGGSSLIPTPVPVKITPHEAGQRSANVSYNTVTMKLEWVDDPWIYDRNETIGDMKVTADHIAVGIKESRSGISTTEWAFFAGRVTMDNETDSYYSDQQGSTVAVDIDGVTGFDLGVRYMGSHLLRKTATGGGTLIEWNWALIADLAYYQTEGDWVYGPRRYKTLIRGLFLRPVIALQPLIRFSDTVSMVPFAGFSATFIGNVEEWEQGTASDTESRAGVIGSQYHVGFDIGIASPFNRKHIISIGGLLAKGAGSGVKDYTDVHLKYEIPLDGK